MIDPLPFQTVRPNPGRDALVILDQTLLPEQAQERTLATLEDVEEAIRSLRVRGAPLIGVTAAWALAVLAERTRAEGCDQVRDLAAAVRHGAGRLARTRPTAVNLSWALSRMETTLELVVGRDGDVPGVVAALMAEAEAIHDQDRIMCRRMGERALELLPPGPAPIRVLTHCNAGALATGGMGTALAPLYLAHAQGRAVQVFADETRPLLQGSRLTAWELAEAGIDVTVIADDMAASLMAQRPLDAVLVGADRIAANGDVANKIGTYGVALLARAHDVPLYVLAPTSTVDLDCATGDDIPIEERDGDEIRKGFGRLTAPEFVQVWNPAFDTTPAELVTAIVTEHGVIRPPFAEGLQAAVESARRTPETVGRGDVIP